MLPSLPFMLSQLAATWVLLACSTKMRAAFKQLQGVVRAAQIVGLPVLQRHSRQDKGLETQVHGDQACQRLHRAIVKPCAPPYPHRNRPKSAGVAERSGTADAM